MIRLYLLDLASKLKRKSIFKIYREFKKREYLPLEENLKFQEDRLKSILVYSWKNVPYYKKILEEARVVKRGRVNLNNFNKIPILTKEILRKNFENLKSNDLTDRTWSYNTSGGSTGEPINLMQDSDMSKEVGAVAWLQNSFVCDYPCKHLKLWGSERDILKKWDILGRMREWRSAVKILNSFKMSEEEMKKYIDEINRYKPEIIEAYVQSIYELAKFIKKNKLNVFSPKGIITSAGTLYPEMRKLIEEIFNTRVFNRYGSREAPSLACSCRKNNELHLNVFTHYIEILDKNLNPCKPGQIGQLYVTLLNNYVMPLIRYKIGDMAVPSKKKQCTCGRGMPLIEKVVGRSMEVFKTRDGKIIPGEFFIHFIGVVYNKDFISKFQVIQEDYDKIKINVVLRNRGEFIKIKGDIEGSIKKVMGNKCKIIWNFVKNIESTKSGKFIYTISKVK